MVNSPALALDHLVINTHFEIDAARLLFEQFGFQLTPRGHHSLGSVNHLLVFEDDYLELIGCPRILHGYGERYLRARSALMG